MIGWSFFFMLVGVSTLASQVFRVVDYIEQPTRHTRRHAAARWRWTFLPSWRS